MNWKERFKPDNNAEKSLYLIISAFVLLIFGGLFFNFLNIRIPIEYLTFIGLSILIPIQIYQFVKEKYVLSNGKAISISIAGSFFIFILCFILIIIMRNLLNILPDSTPEWVKQVASIGGILAVVIIVYTLGKAIGAFVFEKVLKLQLVDTI